VAKVHNKPIKRPRKGFKQREQRTTEGHPGLAHRTVRCATGQCSVPQGRATLNSPASGNRSAKIHRTIRCDRGTTATSRATVDCNTLNARLRAQRSRARAGDTPNSLQGLSGAPPDNQAGPQDRAPTVEPQRSADVAGAPDSDRWRTGLSGAPCDCSLPTAIFWWLGL
jgi:hypothetical protein